MIHIFLHFDPSGSPFAKAVEESGVPCQLFGRSLQLYYTSRLRQVIFGWPRILALSIRFSWDSLFRSSPYPNVLLVGTHLDVVVFSVAKLLRCASTKRPSILYYGFIYVPRDGGIAEKIKRIYLNFIFRLTEKIICHSSHEVEQYKIIFSRSQNKFTYVPYGLYISNEERHQLSSFTSVSQDSEPYIFSAGRSSRDYATLIRSVEKIRIETHIACDRPIDLNGMELPRHVKVLRRCYGSEYTKELEGATIVVIPLAVDNISAGQMVLVQAMAYRKPIIITSTSTIQEYVLDGIDCLLVERGSCEDLEAAIARLLNDRSLAMFIANNARRAYDEKFSIRAYVFNLLAVANTVVNKEGGAG